MRVRGIGLDRCNACRGVWFDSGEINILRRRAQFAPRPELVKSRSQRRRLPRHDGFLGEVAGRVLDAMLQAALEAVGYAVGG